MLIIASWFSSTSLAVPYVVRHDDRHDRHECAAVVRPPARPLRPLRPLRPRPPADRVDASIEDSADPIGSSNRTTGDDDHDDQPMTTNP